MDYESEFDHILVELEWEDVFKTLQDAVEQRTGDTSNSPRSTSPSNALPAGPGFHTHPQPLEGLSEVHDGFNLQELEWQDVYKSVVEQTIGDASNSPLSTSPPPAHPTGPGFTHPQPLEGLSDVHGDCTLQELELEDELNTLVQQTIGDACNSPPSTSPPPAHPTGPGFQINPQPLEEPSDVHGGCTLQQLELEDALNALIQQTIGDASNSPPSTSPPPALPTGPGFTHPQPLEGLSDVHGDCTLQELELEDELNALVQQTIGDAYNSPPSTSPPPSHPTGPGFTHPQPLEGLSDVHGDCTLQELEWEDELNALVQQTIGDACNSPPSTSPPPSHPTGPGFQIHPQPLEEPSDVHGGCTLQQLEWEDALNALVQQTIGDACYSPPSTSPPPVHPAGPGFQIHPQSLEGLSKVHGGFTLQQVRAPPNSFVQPVMAASALNGEQPSVIMHQQPLYEQNVMQPGHLYSQAGAHSQGQYLPFQSAVHSFPGMSTVTTNPAAPPHAYIEASTLRYIEATNQKLVPIGMLNGYMAYGLQRDRAAPSTSAAPSLHTSVSKKRKRTDQQDDGRLYIKKPPNAFMLFRKEQRPNIVAELNITDCASVNKILGQRWKMLSKEDQAKYYEEARKESLLHAQQHPGWSTSDNYGIKRKRQRRKHPITTEASAFNCELVTPPSQTGVMKTSAPLTVPVIEAPHTQTVEMGPSTLWTVGVQQPHVDTTVPEGVRYCHLSNQTAQIFPAAPTVAQTMN